MKLTALLALTAAICCLGCSPEFYANKMVRVDTARGRIAQAALGSPDGLIASGRISVHRPARIGDQTIQLWLINASPEITARTGGESLGTMILIHDIHRSKASMLLLGGRLADMGYDVVLPDLRTHGTSTGEFFTYGVNETRDLKVIMDELLREDSVDDKIIAVGVGLGGSIAIQYAALDPHCAGVVAFQPYADLPSTLRKMSTFALLSDNDLAQVIALAGNIAKFDPAKASTVDAAARLSCPLLVIQRRGDLGYSAAQADSVYDAAGGAKELVEIQLGGDDWSYATAPDRYLSGLINNFANGGLVTGYYRSVMSGEPANTAPPAPQVVPPPAGNDVPSQYPTVIHRTTLR